MPTASAWKLLKSQWIFGVTFLSLVAMTSSAFAQPTPYKEKEKAAKRACIAGEAQVGIGLLADLYADTDEPTYIFNQGRCYQQNNLYEQALGRFREYLRKTPKISAEHKAETDKYINECESLIAKTGLVTSGPAKAETPKHEPVTALRDAQFQWPGEGLRIAGIITATSGFAFLGTGFYLNWYANEQTRKNLNPYSQAKQNSINTCKTLSLAGYGVGVASVVTGGILYFLGWQTGNSERTKVSFMPVIVAGEASLRLRGAF